MTRDVVSTILVVEPDPTVNNAFTNSLMKLGYKVIRAVSARSALDRIRGLVDPLSAAIVEIELPDLDGIQLAGQIQLVQRGVPTIFLTKIRDLDVEGVISAPHLTLLKPCSTHELRQALRSIAWSPSAELR